MADTTAQHLAARNDNDLRQRLVAAAEQQGIDQAQLFVDTNIGKLISRKITGETTITSVHAYASAVRQQALDAVPPAPGLNPAAVTDEQLQAAIQAVWNPAVPE